MFRLRRVGKQNLLKLSKDFHLLLDAKFIVLPKFALLAVEYQHHWKG